MILKFEINHSSAPSFSKRTLADLVVIYLTIFILISNVMRDIIIDPSVSLKVLNF